MFRSCRSLKYPAGAFTAGMERALGDEQATPPRSKAENVSSSCTMRATMHVPCRRHFPSVPSGYDVLLRRTQADNELTLRECEDRRRGFHVIPPAMNKGAKTLGEAHNAQYICEEMEGANMVAIPCDNITSSSVQLRNLEFHSARELTSSTCDEFTTMSGSRAPRGTPDEATTCVKGIPSEGVRTDGVLDVRPKDSGPTRPQGCSEETRQPRAAAERSVSALLSSPASPQEAPFTSEPLLVRCTERQLSTPPSILSASRDQTPVFAENWENRQAPSTCISHTDQDMHIGGAANSNGVAVPPTTEAQGLDVAASIVDRAADHEQRARLPRKRAYCKAGRSMESARRVFGRGTTLDGSEMYEYTSGSSESPPSVGGDTQSVSSVDGLSWIDYPVRNCRTADANGARSHTGSARRYRVGDVSVSKSRRQLVKHSEYLGSRVSGRFAWDTTDRSASFDKADCTPQRARVWEAKAPSKKAGHPADGAFGASRTYFCQSERTKSVKSDGEPNQRCYVGTERGQRRRDSWTNVPHWKARLSLGGSHSRRSESGCESVRFVKASSSQEHQKNFTKRVNQTLRRKMGDAVSRLRRRRVLAIVKHQLPESWCLQMHRESSCANPESHEHFCPQGGRSETQAREDLLFDVRSPRKHRALRRDSDKAEAEAQITNHNTLCIERDHHLGAWTVRAAATAPRAECVEAPPRLSRDRQRSAVVHDSSKIGRTAESRGAYPLISSVTALADCNTDDLPHRSEFSTSVADMRRLLHVEGSSAGGPSSTLFASFASRCESHRLSRCSQSHSRESITRAPEPQEGANSANKAFRMDVRRTGYDPVLTESKEGRRVPCRLSDVVTEASSNHLRHSTDNGKSGTTVSSRGVSQAESDQSQTDEALPFGYTKDPPAEPSRRPQSPGSASKETCSSASTTGGKAHGASTAITGEDIEASIDWIVEASSNPKILRAAQELLLKNTSIERRTAGMCYHSAKSDLPTYCRDREVSAAPSTAESSDGDSTASNSPTKTIHSSKLVYRSPCSSRVSSDNPHLPRRRVQATAKGSHFAAEVLSSVCSEETEDAQMQDSWRWHKPETSTRSYTSVYDRRLRRHSRQELYVHRRGLRAHDKNAIRKISLCYAPSDLAWNMDQLI